MKNEQVCLPGDLNNESPAKKYQQGRDEENGISRRDFLKEIIGGVAVGIAAGGAVKGAMELADLYSKRKESDLKKENPEASEIENALDFIAADLDKIKDKISVSPVGAGRVSVSEKFPAFHEEFIFLKEEGRKLREKEESIPVSVIFSRLEKLENEVSIEVLKVNHGL